jgi:hypothetical protein
MVPGQANGGGTEMIIIVLLGFGVLIAVSRWVWVDAQRRGMNRRWAIWVGAMLIVFLPLYLLVRRPVKCSGCGKAIDSSSELCEHCDEVSASEPDQGRSGRIFG